MSVSHGSPAGPRSSSMAIAFNPAAVSLSAFSEGLMKIPADLVAMAKKRTPSELFWVIKNGVKLTGMPSFGLAGASDQEIWSIVAFVQTYRRDRSRLQGLDGLALKRNTDHPDHIRRP